MRTGQEFIYLTTELQWEPELLMTLVSIRTFGPRSNGRMMTSLIC